MNKTELNRALEGEGVKEAMVTVETETLVMKVGPCDHGLFSLRVTPKDAKRQDDGDPPTYKTLDELAGEACKRLGSVAPRIYRLSRPRGRR